MSNSRSSFNVSGTRTPRNEWTSWSYMENTAYNCTLSYGTCKSSRKLYTFCFNVHDRSYFPVLRIKDLINEDGDTTTPYKLATGTKPSVSHLRVLFGLCVVRKATAHVKTKTLNIRHQVQKGFRGIFVGISQHQKGYLVYVPSTRKVISSYDVMFDESFVSALSYSSWPYAEAMAMRLAVTYTPYATSSKEKTGDVITFAQFEERNLLSETHNDTESGDTGSLDL